MKGMSVEQRKSYVREKSNERARIQKEIQALGVKRHEYIVQNQPAGQESTLDAAMIKAIREKANGKGLSWK